MLCFNSDSVSSSENTSSTTSHCLCARRPITTAVRFVTLYTYGVWTDDSINILFVCVQAVKQMYVLVLGLDVLGNPYGVIRGIGTGVQDLFYEPYQVRSSYFCAWIKPCTAFGCCSGRHSRSAGVCRGFGARRSKFGHLVCQGFCFGLVCHGSLDLDFAFKLPAFG